MTLSLNIHLQETDFINIVAWRNTAEFVSKHFTKGQMINVCGSLQTRTREDEQGVKKYVTEVIADEINFCGDFRSTQHDPMNDVINAMGGTQYPPQGLTPVEPDEDLPF